MIDWQAAYQQIDYQFNDSSLLAQALTHKSYSQNNNERLEFLGDSILNSVISHALYIEFPVASEGDLSRMRASLVRGETLAQIASEKNFGDLIRLGKGELHSGGRKRKSILEDCVEAIIGAIYLDGGWQAAEVVVLKWFEQRIKKVSLGEKRNFKSELQEFLQSQAKELPDYRIEKTQGLEHERVFHVICAVGKVETKGQGRSRKNAEQQAAQKMLEQIYE